jgi:hypothetical protein
MKTLNNPWYYKIEGELIKRKKPCMNGNYVHLKNRNGCYKVHSVHLRYFTIMKNNEIEKISWDCFVCLKGEGQSPEALMKRGLKAAINNINYTMFEQEILLKNLNSFLVGLRK